MITWMLLAVTWACLLWSFYWQWRERQVMRLIKAGYDEALRLIARDRNELLEIVAAVACAPRRMLPGNVVQVDLDADFYQQLVARYVHGVARLETPA